MVRLKWDEVGTRVYETGVSRGVLYIPDALGVYDSAVAWNGLVSVNESPTGAEASPQYADNIKYLNLISAEEFGGTIEAFTYPDEFGQCDGTAELLPGVMIGQQHRKSFGFSYQTLLGNDVESTNLGYKVHVVYGAMATPSDKGYNTVNETPEAIQFSWEISTTPVDVPGHRPTATLTFDSTKLSDTQMEIVKDVLYGTADESGRLPLPAEWLELLA